MDIEHVKLSSNGLYVFLLVLWLATTIFFGISTIESFLGMSADDIKSAINILVLIGLLIKILFFTQLTTRQLHILLFFSAAFLLSAIITRDKTLVVCLLFVVASKDVDYYNAGKKCLFVLLISIGIVITLALTGVIDNVAVSRLANGTQEVRKVLFYRYSLGFLHPNALGAQLLQVGLLWIFVRYENLKLKDVLLGIAACIFINYECNSRSSLYCMVLMIVVTAVLKLIKNEKIIQKVVRVISFAPLVCSLLSVILTVFYKSNPVFAGIDVVFSKRLFISYSAFSKYGFSLFGSKVVLGYKSGIYLDNAYIHLSIKFGISVMIISIVGYFILARYAAKYKNYAVVVCIFIICIHGMFESTVCEMPYNFTIILLGRNIFDYYNDGYHLQAIKNIGLQN